MTHTLWHAKLAAWTHDPAEKALVLLRDPAGHEGGTVAALQREIFGGAGIPGPLRDIVGRADRWAAAADRPQWPRNPADGRYAAWTQVRFTENPMLIHPLSGEAFDLGKLSDLDAQHIKAVSTDHFSGRIVRDATGIDARKTALAFWRFGPETPAPGVGALWGLLPADTRVPDHTIWAHLDLAAAFATAFHDDAGGNPALLAVSLGPVQDFIAQARTTSDLWAGSHFLSRLAWEAMRVVCEQIGPDAVLFPQLRGVPQVDLWLRDAAGLPPEWFADAEWTKAGTDANPLFAAALPNKFVALVPAGRAADLAAAITNAVRAYVMDKAGEALALLCEKADREGAPVAEAQVAAQLAGFPEVHWAAVPWAPLVTQAERETPDTTALAAALAQFAPAGKEGGGFLSSNAWKLLAKETTLDGATFFTPNPGVLYPAVYELLDRVQAAAKAARPFPQLPQLGHRCSLCGEREWLTDDRNLLDLPPGQRKGSRSLWDRLAGTPLARKGEHLCAPCTLKRLWPNLCVTEFRGVVGDDLSRYVVSTHTMALANTLGRWLDGGAQGAPADLMRLSGQLEDRALAVALPRKLALQARKAGDAALKIVKRLPGLLDQQRENAEADLDESATMAGLSRSIEAVLGEKPETYYGLILMDGDRMGAWLAGSEADYQLPYSRTWHPQIRAGLAQHIRAGGGALARYPDEMRPVSPARHMAISAALNSFALQFARLIVEDLGKGKLIYAGGDDVLAMVSVDDLLPVMTLLRLAYSGVFPTGDHAAAAWNLLLGGQPAKIDIGRGHIRYDNRLYRVMGSGATASVGAVIAHHQAPLGHVIRQLRTAEQRAKVTAGRDAFALSLLKRSGGAVNLACPWLTPRDGAGRADWTKISSANLEETPMGQLMRLRDRFAMDSFSRRAAYLTQGWLENIPDDADALAAMLGHQFRRQTSGGAADKAVAETLGHRLAALAIEVRGAQAAAFVRDFLAVAEFLGREGRGNPSPGEHHASAH